MVDIKGDGVKDSKAKEGYIKGEKLKHGRLDSFATGALVGLGSDFSFVRRFCRFEELARSTFVTFCYPNIFVISNKIIAGKPSCIGRFFAILGKPPGFAVSSLVQKTVSPLARLKFLLS